MAYENVSCELQPLDVVLETTVQILILVMIIDTIMICVPNKLLYLVMGIYIQNYGLVHLNSLGLELPLKKLA